MSRMAFLTSLLCICLLSFSQSEILNLRVELEVNQPTRVVMTDGIVSNTALNASWRGCGIGPGIIFIKNEYGLCQTMDSFNVKRGSVNQLHIDSTKNKYYEGTLTFMSADWLQLSGTLAPEFYKAATKGFPGRRNDQGKLVDVTITKGAVTNERVVNGFSIFRLGVDTSIVSKVLTGSFCSTTAHACATSWTTGASPDEVIYGEGNGRIGFIVITQYPNPYPYARVIVWPGKDEKYFPQELTEIASKPMGVTFETALRAGLKSVASDMYFFQKGENEHNIVERQVALGISTAALIRVEGVNDALKAALAISDAKDKEHEAAIALGFEYTRILGEKIANTMETALVLSERTYTLALQNEVLGVMLDQLALKVDYLEQFTLFVVDYFQTRDSVVYQNLEKYRNAILEKYPTGRIITEQQVGTSIYYTISVDGNIISSNTVAPCSADRCYLPGKWYKYLEPRVTKLVENPLLGLYDCGIYFQTPGLESRTPASDDANLQVIAYFNSLEIALNHLKGKKFPYAYVNLLECPSDFQISAGMVHEANDLLSQYGFDQVQALADNRFLVNCTPRNYTTVEKGTNQSRFMDYIQEDIVCSQRISYDELRSFVSRIQPPVFSRRSALDAYNAAFNSATSFERVMQRLGSAGIDALTEIVGIPGDVLKALASGEILRSSKMSQAALGVSICALVIAIISGFLLMCFIAKQGKRRRISEESKKDTTGMGTMNPSASLED